VIFFMVRINTRTPSPNKLESVRIVDVGLDHRGIDAHPAPLGQPVFLGDLHHPLVNLADDLGPQGYAPAAHGLGVGRLRPADPGEVAVHQIGAHLALQHAIAPVADMLQDQQSQHHFGRSAQATAAAALGMPLRESFVHGRYELFIR
jgi:hypothetical protein